MDASPSSFDQPLVGSGLFERAIVLDAFLRNPGSSWTPVSLSSWYGIRLDLVRAVLGEFVEEGIIRSPRGEPDRYILNPDSPLPANGSGGSADPVERDEIDHRRVGSEPGAIADRELVVLVSGAAT